MLPTICTFIKIDYDFIKITILNNTYRVWRGAGCAEANFFMGLNRNKDILENLLIFEIFTK